MKYKMMKNKIFQPAKNSGVFRIIQEHAKCISCGACIAACPSNWQWAKDGKAVQKKKEIDEKELKCNKSAADACPVHIISIKKA